MSLYSRVALIAVMLALATAGAIRFAPQAEEVRVVDNTPRGSGVALDSIITVTFSRSVDRRSAERSMIVYPVVKGHFQWHDDRTVSFIPDDQLKPYTEYRVKVRIGLRDTRFHTNRTETQWPFLTRR